MSQTFVEIQILNEPKIVIAPLNAVSIEIEEPDEPLKKEMKELNLPMKPKEYRVFVYGRGVGRISEEQFKKLMERVKHEWENYEV